MFALGDTNINWGDLQMLARDKSSRVFLCHI